MKRQLDRQDSNIAFQGYLPGCMWSVLRILDHHYWHSSKKNSPRRKHRRGKRTICFGYPKTVSFEHYTDEVHNYLDSDAVPLTAEQQSMNHGPSDSNSSKAHIKALVAKEMSDRSQMQRADSFSHLRPSDALGGIKNNWSNPIIILEKSPDTTASRLQPPSLPKSPQAFSSDSGNNLVNASLNHNYPDAKKLTREISHHQIMECVDVLEIFKINKKLFLDISQEPDARAAKNFQVQLTSDMKVRLKKSGSFPLANSPDNRHSRPSTLEHKWRETWSFRKGEKFDSVFELPRYIPSKSLKDFHGENKEIKADNSEALDVTQESGFSSVSLSQGSPKYWWHQSFMSHLKDMMKKMKHTLKESKRQKNRVSMDVSPIDEKEYPGKLEEVTVHQDGKENSQSCHETSSSHKDLCKDQLSHMRRVSSLNESLDRYARLIDYSLDREAKWHDYKSKSLRLVNEDNIPATGHRIRSFKRRLSLPDLDSFCPLPNEISQEALHSQMPIKNFMECDTTNKNEGLNGSSLARTLVDRQQFNLLDAVEECELQKNMEKEGDGCKNNEHSDFLVHMEEVANTGRMHEGVVEPEKQRHVAYQDHEIGSTISSSKEHEEQIHVSVLATYMESPVPEGSELDYRHISTDEVKSSVDLQDNCSRDCSNNASHENDENVQTMIENNFLHSEIKELDDADFNYVRDVLEVSGLIQQGYLGAWHSLDQPLSPTLFKELEAYLHRDGCSSEDVDCNCDHQLLFDLINEVLLQIYESSLAYFPKPFSFVQHVRPVPKGDHILQEVWKRISWHRGPKLRMDHSLDDIVARDLSKDDGWMKLQLDVEDLALDLEDLIFDELLDEVIC